MLLLCFGLLSPSPFFLNHEVSLYLLAFSKLQLPGVVRECVRHGITRNRFGLYTEKKQKQKQPGAGSIQRGAFWGATSARPR